MSDSELEALSFEDSMAQLQQIVAQLEQGNLPMEESIALYERGTRLARQCQLRLESGELTTSPFVPPK